MRIHPAAVMLAAAVGLIGAEALACSCFPLDPSRRGVIERIEASAAVFRGKVLAVAPLEDQPFPRRLRITLRVAESWKGVTTTQIDLVTEASSAACGLSARVGSELLVFAYPLEDGAIGSIRYSVDSCNGTTGISDLQFRHREWLSYLAKQPTLALTSDRAVTGSGAEEGASSTPPAVGAETYATAPTQLAEASGPVARPRAGGCASCSSTGAGLGALPLLALVRFRRRRRP